MSARNKKVVLGFMHGLNEGQTRSFINTLTDDVRWNIVGMPLIRGKENVLQAVEMMELWKSTSNKGGGISGQVKNIIADKEFVVVENSAKNSSSANCDIFRIINGKISEVTSYIVDTSASE